MSKTYTTYVILAFLTIAATSCNNKAKKYHNVMEKIEAESKDYQGIATSSSRLLEGERLIEITEGKHTFLIPERKSKLEQFACTECHSKPLARMKGKDVKKSHWQIKMHHADAEVMNCATCHNAANMDQLTSLVDKEIDFDRSDKQCAQCHSSQFEDWKGGAHGKKIAGWATPRASMTCVNCHDPHSPHFDERWPALYNTKKVEERHERLER